MKNYDVIVIGSGGGGKITSPAARMGYKVAVVEKSALGGTCLNRGCIPSKMLIHPADVAMEIKESAKLDLKLNSRISVNFANLITRISNTVDHDSASIGQAYAKNPNIDFYPVEGRFVDNKVVKVGHEEITAEKIFIAVGSRPHIPDISGLKHTPYMTSTEALRNTKLPNKMVVLGGGYIATELGHAYGALGTQVHFMVRSTLLRFEDSQISEEFNRVFREHHQVHYGVVPTKVEYANDFFTITYKTPEGQERQITCDALLVCTGVVPNTDLLGLENTRIKLRPGGFIQVDNRLQTPVDGVYALGDCIGNYLFRHSVNFEGEYLFRTVFEEPSTEPIRYPPMPHAVFSWPQVAGVGKTEDELIRDRVEYIVGANSYEKSAMGMARLSDHGFVKLLFERKTKKLVGAHIIGPEASDMLHMLIAFMYKEATIDDLLGMIYIHPALPEIVRNAARKARAAFDVPVASGQ